MSAQEKSAEGHLRPPLAHLSLSEFRRGLAERGWSGLGRVWRAKADVERRAEANLFVISGIGDLAFWAGCILRRGVDCLTFF
jgi:hypothetical protein